MYSLMLVDDEDEVREGIMEKTDWAACGFRLAGAYENGRDAAEALEALRPDVLITDICMPFMDGLELSRYAAEISRDTKIVIITGYEEFDYAKEAIKLRVNEYLLKPINAREFMAFLGRLKTELDEQRASRENLSVIRQQLNQSLPLLKERFLERLSASVMKKEELHRKLEYFGLTLPGPAFVSMVADIDPRQNPQAAGGAADAGSDLELLHFAVFNIFQEIFEKENGGAVFRTRDDRIGVLLCGLPESIGPLAQNLAAHAAHSVEKYLKLTLTIGIGRHCTALTQVPRSFREAGSALDYRLLLGSNRILCISDLEQGTSLHSMEYLEWEKKLLSALKMGKGSQVSSVLSAWLEEWRSAGLPVEKCYGMLYKFVVALMNWVAETGCGEAEVFGEDPFREMRALRTLDQLKQWLEGLCHRVICTLGERRSLATQSQMHLAEAYIKEHYVSESLSLQQVCDHIYMSASYFSACFKQHTGLTFVEYLTRLRIDKAKELLAATALKAYDIASRVGYPDPQYFSVIFKRHTGRTPKEFRLLAAAGETV
ncbi:helix-turn-helix domain-containing protein [Paenibacillus mucilaginosus]|uniref:YesN20 n=1 Tax=Paenibacillus mucilaginosus (strain KNP414) TaxID=1036673 RepID=F8FKC9_PAEMK|nr:helix-turn-helix domain-containing protein [Paenibacillus mucilaginosus]AEI44810.1 YesN20 [Paenibacillus mucilaginosus KNP414]MCG7214857.1 helix-turn-helix domain-containing protein [Paenibacillus mucilaginosus]WDM26338.1 helix-turn-helix domain-containing protein [Paenibacillus mucilaginosus]